MDTRRLAVFLAGAAAFASLYAPQSLLPALRPWLGNEAVLAGLVVSAATFGVALAAPFMGRLGDRLGRRRVIVTAAFVAVLPTLGIAAAQNVQQMIAARFLEGLIVPGIFAVTVAYVPEMWPREQARAVSALYVSGTVFGGFFGRLTSGLVAEFSNWRWAFLALALLQLAYACALYVWLAHDPRRETNPRPAPTILALLAEPALRGAYLAGFTILFALMGGFTYISLTLALPPYGLGPAALSAMFTVYLAGAMLTPLAGRLLNALGYMRVLVMAWSLAICGLLFTCLHGLPEIIFGLCLFAAGLFLAQTTVTTFVGEVMPTARGAAVGLYVTCYYVGGTVGGILPAPLWTSAGWPAVAALIAVAGVISVLSARRSFAAQVPVASRPLSLAPTPAR